jgi:exodeoxyribonuclease VII small subunit
MNSPDTTFEESILRLDEILKQLEGEKVDLATALSQYEEGVRLLKHCHTILETTRQKIEILRSIKPDGTPIVEPLDVTSGLG